MHVIHFRSCILELERMLKIFCLQLQPSGSLPRGQPRPARKLSTRFPLFLPPPSPFSVILSRISLSRDLPQDFPPLRSILAGPRYIFPLGFAKKSGRRRWTRKMDREKRETRARRIDMRAKRKVQATRTNGIGLFLESGILASRLSVLMLPR